jgi:uncharacterized protein YigA (DUF484 family)
MTDKPKEPIEGPKSESLEASDVAGALRYKGLHGALYIANRDQEQYKSSVGTIVLNCITEILGRILPRLTTALRVVN